MYVHVHVHDSTGIKMIGSKYSNKVGPECPWIPQPSKILANNTNDHKVQGFLLLKMGLNNNVIVDLRGLNFLEGMSPEKWSTLSKIDSYSPIPLRNPL